MTLYILICAIVIIVCVISSKLSNKFGIPTLLLFIILGMLFGSNSISKISFNNYKLAEDICTIALVFIMFYGGFWTNWKVAKPVAARSILLSTIGVVITAVLTGLFCVYVLNMNFKEGLLIGCVISSTDSASVFSILKSKKLNLKGGISSILEIESGSNDPIAYMSMIIVLSLMSSTTNNNSIAYILFAQIAYSILISAAIATLSVLTLSKISFAANGLDTIFVLAIALLSYALPTYVGGNGYLSAYIVGIILGNSKIFNKISLIHFFDGVTSLMQILMFFLLGLLSDPSKILAVLLPSVLIALFLTLVSRPIAVFSILTPFKTPIKQMTLVSAAGLRD